MNKWNKKDANYNKYLKRLHLKKTTDIKVIKYFIKKAIGKNNLSLKRLMLGESNEVYEVKIKDGESIILRISHAKENSFKKEIWPLEQCRKMGIPVPNILFMEDVFLDKGVFRSFCFMNKIKGESLATRINNKTITTDEVEKIVLEAGNILSKIHSVKTEKFGMLQDNGKGVLNSWTDFIFQNMQEKQKMLTNKVVVARKGRDPSVIDKVIQILQENKKTFDVITPHLLHGDFSKDHILTNGGKITGIIDFGGVLSGDPVEDFAWWVYFNTDNTIDLLIKGYADKTLFKNSFMARSHLYLLDISLFFLDYYNKGGLESGIDMAIFNLKKGMSYFRGKGV